VKALAIGNPLIKTRVETANELRRISGLQRKLAESQIAMKEELLSIPGRISQAWTLIKQADLDMAHYEKNQVDFKEMEIKTHREIGAEILEAVKMNVMHHKKRTLLALSRI